MMREELGRSQIAERLVRSNVIVGVFPGTLCCAKCREVQLSGIGFIKLFGVGAVGPFHGAVELRRTRGQDEQPNAAVLTGLLKGGGELTAAIDLNGPDRHGHTPEERDKKLGGRDTGGSTIGFDHVPPRHDIARGELFEDDTRARPHIERIDLDEIAGGDGGVVSRLTGRIKLATLLEQTFNVFPDQVRFKLTGSLTCLSRLSLAFFVQISRTNHCTKPSGRSQQSRSGLSRMHSHSLAAGGAWDTTGSRFHRGEA